MNKYLAIINLKIPALSIVCVVVTCVCFAFDPAYNINITHFSIAVIFPLVFSIREGFRRRDSAKMRPVANTCGRSALHAFIPISRYNMQIQMEKPCDQLGLDETQLDEFRHRARADEPGADAVAAPW